MKIGESGMLFESDRHPDVVTLETMGAVLDDQKINGTPEEEADFGRFKREALADLSLDEKKMLSRLNAHHEQSFRHSIMVARDSEYIAKELELGEEDLLQIRKAAFLHDIGKLSVHNEILDLGGFEEMEAIWKMAYPGKPLPEKRMITVMTVEDVVNYKAKQSANPKKYIKDFQDWMQARGAGRYYICPVYDYLRYHQEAGRKMMRQSGVWQPIVDLAAGHHLSYYSAEERKNIPKNCRIIEIADKFNAMIQSGGLRKYIGEANKKTRTEALNVIIFELKNELGEGMGELEKRTLEILIKTHIIKEIEEDIKPDAQSVIDYLETNVRAGQQESIEPAKLEQSKKLVLLISLIVGLADEFCTPLDKAIISELEGYKARIEEILGGTVFDVGPTKTLS